MNLHKHIALILKINGHPNRQNVIQQKTVLSFFSVTKTKKALQLMNVERYQGA